MVSVTSDQDHFTFIYKNH